MEKSNLMMIVIIVLLVALLGTVVGVTFYAFNMVQNMEQAATRAAEGFDRTPRQLTPEEIGRVMIGDAIITNLATDDGRSGGTARIQVVVGYDNTDGRESDEMRERLEEQITYIRMVAMDRIGSRTFVELTAPGARERLSEEILEILVNEFMTNMIVEVGFYEWIVQ